MTGDGETKMVRMSFTVNSFAFAIPWHLIFHAALVQILYQIHVISDILRSHHIGYRSVLDHGTTMVMFYF